MKRILTIIAAITLFSVAALADDRPVSPEQLPSAAIAFLNQYFPDTKITYATKDDDLIRPDFNVGLSDGTRVHFSNGGKLEEIENPTSGVPGAIIPVQIAEYVKNHYPDVLVKEYEVGRRTYDVKLSNRLELKFNSNFNIIEIDD